MYSKRIEILEIGMADAQAMAEFEFKQGNAEQEEYWNKRYEDLEAKRDWTVERSK